MTEWSETNSSTFREIAAVAIPRRREMMATIVSLVPFNPNESFHIVELGSGEGDLAVALLNCFPQATVLALDGSPSMRERAAIRTKSFADRIRVRDFDAAALDWWDLMAGAGLVVSSLCLHHLNDAKKQYLYKAIADRLLDRGALLIADLIEPSHPAATRLAAEMWDARTELQAVHSGRVELFGKFVAARWNHYRFPDSADQPSPIFHHLVWLKHAGFAAVDCFWMCAGHAVFGAFKLSGATASAGGVSFERAKAST
jgi:ubiquinone/menaquinone biosynthesis C-methylase UbiE